MASRIHNFSYSGGTGALTFVPCTGTEVACKVYIKSIRATVNYSAATNFEGTEFSVGNALVNLLLSTKSANNSSNLTRASWIGSAPNSTTSQNTVEISLTGGCTSIVLSHSLANPPVSWQQWTQRLFSGVGTENWYANSSSFGYVQWNVPEYFYMKPGETLTLSGYVGTFHIELMAISETN